MAQGFPSNEVCSQLQANGKYKVLNEIPITHEQVDWRRDANHRGCNLQCHSKDRYIQGIMVEMRGTNESEPCDECKKGCGPFLDCRRLQLPNGEWALDGACANCWYRHHPEWCTCDDGPANSTNPPPAQAPVAVQQTPPPAPPALPLSSQTPYVEALQSRIQTKAPFEHNIWFLDRFAELFPPQAVVESFQIKCPSGNGSLLSMRCEITPDNLQNFVTYFAEPEIYPTTCYQSATKDDIQYFHPNFVLKTLFLGENFMEIVENDEKMQLWWNSWRKIGVLKPQLSKEILKYSISSSTCPNLSSSTEKKYMFSFCTKRWIKCAEAKEQCTHSN